MQSESQILFDSLVQRPANIRQCTKLSSLNDVEWNYMLIEACKQQQLRVVELFQRREIKVTRALPVNTRTAIHVAAELGQSKYFDVLCDIYDNQVNYTDPESGFTHFQAALRIGNIRMVNSLESQGILENRFSVWTAFFRGTLEPSVFHVLLRPPFYQGPVGHTGYTLLSHLCSLLATTTPATENRAEKYMIMIEKMIEKRADDNVIDANVVDTHGMSPALHLFRHGILSLGYQRKALKILIGANANMRHRDNQGKTILHYMLSHRYPFNLLRGYLELVHRGGADLNAPDNNGVTPLSYAVSVCNQHAVKELLRKGAEPTTVTFKGEFLNETSGVLRNLELTQNILRIMELLKAKKGFRMTIGHDCSVLQFLMGYPTVHHELFDPPYVMALASNQQALSSYCHQYINKSNEGQQDRANSVRQALINHLKIVHFGKIQINAKTKKWMKDEVEKFTSVREIYSEDPEILREIELARDTKFGDTTVTLLDVCTHSTHRNYHQLQLVKNWESVVYNAETFGKFVRIGLAIKGCLTRALVRQFFDENRSNYVKEYF